MISNIISRIPQNKEFQEFPREFQIISMNFQQNFKEFQISSNRISKEFPIEFQDFPTEFQIISKNDGISKNFK